MNRRIAFALASSLLFDAGAAAQKPVAELPRTHIDTTWNQPTGGKAWAAHTADEFSRALAQSSPGDVITLDAGTVYTGNFRIPAKTNPNDKWIYVTSSAYSKLPAPGKRVSPSDAANMPKVVTPNVATAIGINESANHWRFVGIEVYSASTFAPPKNPPGVYSGYTLINNFTYPPVNLPDSIVFDRCYVHGDASHDVQAGISGNGRNYAVVDSYIADIHMKGVDTQAFNAYYTPGPIKLVNNHFEAAGENVMFGGAGGPADPYVPSDIEVRNNHLFKPLSWVPLSLNGTYVEKNAFELKSARRVLFDNNTIENVWAAGQVGAAFLLTIRTSQSGDIAAVEDVTVTNNVFKNVVMGFSTLATDNLCGPPAYPNCKNSGNSARWTIANNLITLYDSSIPGGIGAHTGLIVFSGGMDRPHGVFTFLHDIVLQHNTVVPHPSKPCWQSIYFGVPGVWKRPFPRSTTDNVWILDNVLCKQPTGDWGVQGKAGLTEYMGAPGTPPFDLAQRFTGNVMYVSPGEQMQSFPPHNLSTGKTFRYVDPAKGNFELLEPRWTETTDERPAGVDSAILPK